MYSRDTGRGNSREGAAAGAAQRGACLAALRESEAARVEEAIELGDRRL